MVSFPITSAILIHASGSSSSEIIEKVISSSLSKEVSLRSEKIVAVLLVRVIPSKVNFLALFVYSLNEGTYFAS